MPMADRESLRSALASTLVKSSDHFRAFDLIFDIFFAGRRFGAGVRPDPDGQDGQAGPGRTPPGPPTARHRGRSCRRSPTPS